MNGSAAPASGNAAATARPLLVDAREAARLLGIGRTKLYELMNDGSITPVHIGRCVRLPVAELERSVASGCVVADARPQLAARKVRARQRSTRRPMLRDVTPRLFDHAT